jgi:hypothetical protein
MVRNLEPVCTAATRLYGYALSFEQAVEDDLNLSCDLAVCAVDNNPARVAVSRYFRAAGVPVIVLAVSAETDHGYVFIQRPEGPCLGCLFPDIANDDRYPCPGTPAVADILQAVGSLAVYSVDTILMNRQRTWNYRRINLGDRTLDAACQVTLRRDCPLCRLMGRQGGGGIQAIVKSRLLSA